MPAKVFVEVKKFHLLCSDLWQFHCILKNIIRIHTRLAFVDVDAKLTDKKKG